MKKILILNFLFLFTLSQNSSSQTDNRSNITIETHHVVIETVDGELIVTDAMLINIHSVEQSDELISFSVPGGYKHFEVLSGLNEDSLLKEEDRVLDTRKVQEGKCPVAFRYKLRIKGDTYHLPLDIYYDTEVFYFLVKSLELSVESEHLIDEGLLDMGERKYYALSGEELKKGERIYITINGLGKQDRRRKVLVVSVPLLIIIIIISVFIFKKGKGEKESSTPSDTLIEEKNSLISTLANLDEEFENGEIDESTYMELRKEYKEKLKKIILKIENG